MKMKISSFMQKNSIWLILGLCFYSCTLSNKESNDIASLAGTWKRAMENEHEVAYEIWKSEGDHLKGLGVVINNKDTVFVEDLRIFEDAGTLYYGASTSDNEEEILFKHSGVSDGYHVFENKEHDFPKFIKYKWNDSELHATVGDDNRQLEFIFTKVNS